MIYKLELTDLSKVHLASSIRFQIGRLDFYVTVTKRGLGSDKPLLWIIIGYDEYDEDPHEHYIPVENGDWKIALNKAATYCGRYADEFAEGIKRDLETTDIHKLLLEKNDDCPSIDGQSQ